MEMTNRSPADSFARRMAAEIRAEMARQGMSQTALCERLGWQQQRLSRRLSLGATLVPIDSVELAEIAQALGVPASQLIPGDPAEVTA